MRRACGGFTLTELAIVLVIVALLLGGLLVPLASQYDSANIAATQRTLTDVRDALIGYAVAHDRLPCPAKPGPGTTGVESPAGGVCTNPYDGLVPAITLGLPNQDSSGFLLDAWGNRIHYAVTQKNGNAFTTSSGMKLTGIQSLTPDIHVCAAATNPPSAACAGTTLTTDAPALVFSTGKDGPGGTGNDEIANLAGANPYFVSHDPTPAPNQFDDIVLWLPSSILYNRMVAAGRLP